MSLRKLLPLAFVALAPLAARSQTISTVAGGGPINLTPTAASVGSPAAVRQDSLGNTYILDGFTNRVLKIPATGPDAGKLSVFAGNGVDGYNGNGGQRLNVEFSGPVGMCIDSHDNVWVADSDNALVRKILVSLTGANAGEQIDHVYDIVGQQSGNTYTYGGDDGPMASANLHFPDGCSFDTRGNLYIADRGNNAIRVAITGTPFGTFTTAGDIYTFAGGTDGVDHVSAPSPGVAADGDTAIGGLLNGPWDVFVDSQNNVYMGLVGNPPPSVNPPPTANLIRVVWATDHGAQLAGKIYTVAGCIASCVTTDGALATTVSLNGPLGISVNANGDVFFADPGNFVVREVPSAVAPPAGMTAGNLYIVAGGGQKGFFGDGHPAVDPIVRLANPLGTFVDSTGALFIADLSGNTIRHVDGTPADYTQRLISTFAGNGRTLYGGDGSPAADGELHAPTGIATDGTGHLLIADTGSSVLRGVPAPISTGNLLTLAGQPENEDSVGENVPAGTAIVNRPLGAAIDSAGNTYIADTESCVVRKVDTNGNITTIAGTFPTPTGTDPQPTAKHCGSATDGALAIGALLGNINGVAVNSVGDVYFSDATNNLIWVLAANTTVAPARTAGHIYIVSTGTTLSLPTGIFIDSFDNVYFADTNRHVVREIPASTGNGLTAGVLTTIAGIDGANGYDGDGAGATSAHLNSPFGVFVDGAGNVFISDTNNNVIREVAGVTAGGKTKGSIYTVAGTNVAGFNGDGIAATTALLHAPKGLAQGPSDSLLLSDSANNRIRSISNLTTNPALSVNKAALDFGNQPVLIASAALTVTVKNTGATAITLNAPQISGTNAADFAFTNHCGATLAPSATCTVDVNFTPSVTSAESATLTLSDTVPESRTVALTGTGVLGIPGATVTPNPLPAFALQTVGTTSATGKDVTVTNNGTAVLNFTTPNQFTFTGTNSTDFTQTTTCGATLAVSASCTITVKFAPTAAGTRTASLSIADNAGGSPQVVPVSGTAAVPTADLSVTTLGFPDQTINTPSATKTVTLTNNGTVPLTLNPAIAITGDFSQTNDCVSPIAAAAHCTITVTFTPTVAGARTGTITISDNASPTGVTTTQTVALTGNGISSIPTLALTGTTTQTVKAGATATYALQLNATGGIPTTAYTVTFACSGAPSKATCTAPASVIVTPGTPTAVTVTVSTTAASTLVPFSEPNIQGPAAMRFLPLTIVSLLLCIAMMLAWMQNPASRMRLVRFAVTACLVLVPIAMGAMLTGCASTNGSGSTPPPTPVPGTPAGTYTITVTSTVNGQASKTPLTLIVQ
jgi:hypothetical protein